MHSIGVGVFLLIDNQLNKNAAWILKVARNPVLLKIVHLFVCGNSRMINGTSNKVQVLILI